MSPEASLPFKVRVFSDFDGTISNKDSLKHLLVKHAGSTFQQLEAGILSGQIPEAQALPKMFENFPLLPLEAQAEVLDTVQVDSSFRNFAQWCRSSGVELTILSGGFESFIRPLLAREGLEDLEIIANDIDQNWSIRRAPVKALCSLCTHCKSSSLLDESKTEDKNLIVYIGDGHTDFCPVQLAHLVFAKSALREHCLSYGRQFLDFETFEDVLMKLQQSLSFIHEGLCDENSVEYFYNECERRFGYQATELLKKVA